MIATRTATDSARELAQSAEAEWRVIRSILDSPTWSRPVAMLERIAGLCVGIEHGATVLASMVGDGWIVRWMPPAQTIAEGTKVRNVPMPEVATLHEHGAAMLGYTLIQPAQDGDEAEPRWGLADAAYFDETGRHPGEPDHFVIEQDWGGLKRSMTLFDRIAAARDMEKKNRRVDKKSRNARSRGEYGG